MKYKDKEINRKKERKQSSYGQITSNLRHITCTKTQSGNLANLSPTITHSCSKLSI